jgi:hypothetical protein
VRAGDDVDICWRLQRKGYRIAFAPSALVWHHHRDSLRAYWKQQVGYGEGEGWLMDRHPEKFAGERPLWRGRIYSPLPFVRSLWPVHINTGRWGTALFPSVYRRDVRAGAYLPHRFRWQALSLLLIVAGALAAVLGFTTATVLLSMAGAAGFTTTAYRCLSFASRSDLDRVPAIAGWPTVNRLLYTLTIGYLHYVQPFARAVGRLRAAQAPGGPALIVRRRRLRPAGVSAADFATGLRLALGGIDRRRLWSESWVSAEALLSKIASGVTAAQAFRAVEVDEGWHSDRDIRVGVPGIGALDLRALVEEHSRGRCLVRVATRLRIAPITGAAPLGAAAVTGVMSELLAGTPAEVVLATALVAVPLIVGLIAWRVGRAVGVVRSVLNQVSDSMALHPLDLTAARRGEDRPERMAAPTHLSFGTPVDGQLTVQMPAHEQQHET